MATTADHHAPRPIRTRRRSSLPHLQVPGPRNATTALAILFALDGFVFGSWAARVPDVSAAVGATHAGLGAVLLCMSVGALATMRVTGALCERLGPGVVSTATAVLLCLSAVLPGLATSLPVLGATLVLFGAATGAMNVAINSMGVRLTEGGDRPVLPLLHAVFSFGGLAGGLVGGLAALVTAPVLHLLLVAGAGLVVVRAVARPLLDLQRPVRAPRSATGRGGSTVPAGARATIVALGAIAGCTAYGEGALSDWGALHLSTTLQASPLLAAAGYAGFSLAMACGRLLGHRLVDLLGETRLMVSGSLLGAAGMLLAAWSPALVPALLGFLLVGLGLANLFPLAIGRAGALGGAGGVAMASGVGYAGLLGGPPVIGFLAEWTGLPTALTTISLLAAVSAVLALGAREGRRPSVTSSTPRTTARLTRPTPAPLGPTWVERRDARLQAFARGGPDASVPERTDAFRRDPGLVILWPFRHAVPEAWSGRRSA